MLDARILLVLDWRPVTTRWWATTLSLAQETTAYGGGSGGIGHVRGRERALHNYRAIANLQVPLRGGAGLVDDVQSLAERLVAAKCVLDLGVDLELSVGRAGEAERLVEADRAGRGLVVACLTDRLVLGQQLVDDDIDV